MSMLLRVKAVAALLLLASLALPQSTCSGYRGADGRFVPEIPRDAAPGAYQPAIERQYALDDFKVTNPESWIPLLLFVWPVVAVAILALARGRSLRRSVAILEPILALCSAYLIWSFATVLATPAVGAYLAIAALAIYLTTCMVELWRAVRSRRAATVNAPAHTRSPS